MLLSPYLTSEQLQSWMMDVLSPLTALSNVASLVAKNHSAVQSALQSALLDYLQNEGIRYDIRQGDKSKPNLHNLVPMTGDIVIYQTSDHKTRFGVITEIKEKNIVTIRTNHYGTVQSVDKHVRLLKLLYRSSEWLPSGIPVNLYH
jgi:hypothetical protein